MPYKLRKVPKKDLYWVVSKETGKKHSKEGLPLEQAKAQMRALYAAEGGYEMRGEGKGVFHELNRQLTLAGRRQKAAEAQRQKDVAATQVAFFNEPFSSSILERNIMPFLQGRSTEERVRQTIQERGQRRARFQDQRKAEQAFQEGLVGRELMREITGKALPTMNSSTLSEMARMPYKTGKDVKTNIDGWELFHSTPTLKFYRKNGEMIVAVRGSQTLSDWTNSNTKILSNKLREGNRYKEDSAEIRKMIQFAPNLYGVGHSLGGALMDEFIKDGLVAEAVSFNPAVQPKFYEDEDLAQKHKRFYYKGDPVYEVMGKYTTGAQVVPREPEDWIVEYAVRFPDVRELAKGVVSAGKELAKSRLPNIPSIASSLYAHQASRFKKDYDLMTGGATLMERATKAAKSVTDAVKSAAKDVTGKVATLRGSLPQGWTAEQWTAFFQYADAVVFDTLSEDKAKEVVTIILTGLALLPKLQAAMAAGLGFWEACAVLLPLVTSSAATAGLTFTIPAIGGGAPIVIGVGTAIAIFWGIYYVHEYFYPACNAQLVEQGKPCNPQRKKGKQVELVKELKGVKAEYDAREKEKAELQKGKGIKEKASRALRKREEESEKKDEPSRADYLLALGEEAVRLLQQKYRRGRPGQLAPGERPPALDMSLVPPPPRLTRERRRGRRNTDSEEEGQGMPKGNKRAGFVGLMLAKKHLGKTPEDYDPTADPKRTPARFSVTKIREPSKYIQEAYPVGKRGRPKKEVVALAPTGRFSKAQRDELKARAAAGDAQAQATLEELRRVERERKKKPRGGVLHTQRDAGGGDMFNVVDSVTGQRVAGPMTEAEANAYIRSQSPPRQTRPAVEPPNQKKLREEAKRREEEARRAARKAARRQRRAPRKTEAERIRRRIEEGTATAAELAWYEDYWRNESTSGSE